jgi:prepilin-type N-terminal cleavage/methylation domain-containing protein
MRHAGRGDEGFSLVEVLVALTILAVGLLSLALLQVTAIKGNAGAWKSTIATDLAQAKLELFRRDAWAAIDNSTTTTFGGGTIPIYANVPADAGDNFPVRGTTFYRIWRVLPTTPSLKTITVWTCWRDDLGNWHSVMLVTQRANVGS